MKYTFGQAKRILVSACHSKMTDVGDKINAALEALCGLNPWEHEFLRQVVRISSVAPVISLPQGATGLVRACVNGKPTTLHGQDFQFLSGGPGDLEHVPFGYERYAGDIAETGFSPVWIQPSGPTRLRAVSSSSAAQPDLVVDALTPAGDAVKLRLPVAQEGAEAAFDDTTVSSIVHVVVDTSSTAHISLRMETSDGEAEIARYNPKIAVPEFRQYRLPDRHRAKMRPHEAYDILAEIQFEPVPLVDDSDVIPIPTLEPIKAMILYEYSNQNMESKAADAYLNQAMSWVTRLNSAKNTRQEPTVVNVEREGSLGQLSDFFANI